MIKIDIDTTVYQLVKEYPTIKEIMIELGFKDIVKPGLLQSVGRIMSIKRGCEMRGMDIDEVKQVFEVNGFILEDLE